MAGGARAPLLAVPRLGFLRVPALPGRGRGGAADSAAGRALGGTGVQPGSDRPARGVQVPRRRGAEGGRLQQAVSRGGARAQGEPGAERAGRKHPRGALLPEPVPRRGHVAGRSPDRLRLRGELPAGRLLGGLRPPLRGVRGAAGPEGPVGGAALQAGPLPAGGFPRLQIVPLQGQHRAPAPAPGGGRGFRPAAGGPGLPRPHAQGPAGGAAAGRHPEHRYLLKAARSPPGFAWCVPSREGSGPGCLPGGGEGTRPRGVWLRRVDGGSELNHVPAPSPLEPAAGPSQDFLGAQRGTVGVGEHHQGLSGCARLGPYSAQCLGSARHQPQSFSEAFLRATSVLTARGQQGRQQKTPQELAASGPGGILPPWHGCPRQGTRWPQELLPWGSPSAGLQLCPLLREQSAPGRAFLVFCKEQKQNKGGLSLKYKQRAALWD